MKFSYTAYRADGTREQGVTEASSAGEAQKSLRAGGLFPEVLEPLGSSDRAARGGIRLGGGGRLRQLTGLTRQLAVMLSSGTPLVDALSAVQRQTRDPLWKQALGDVVEQVERGSTLSEAMARHPRQFDAMYRGLIAAGEAGGDMRQILDRLVTMTRQQMVVQSTITGAMVYPALLLTISSGVLVGLVLNVLPKFEGLFETLNAPLPPSTAALISFSAFVREHVLLLGLGLGAAVAGAVVYLRSAAGRAGLDWFAVSAPLLGRTVRAVRVARLVRVLGVLLESRVPLLEALSIAQSCTNSGLYGRLIEATSQRVERGEPLADTLAASPLVDPSVAEAIRSGEQTGRVGPVLVVMADMMDEDNALLIRTLTSVMEPVILALLGVLVGGVAISLFLPLFDLTAATGGG